MKIKTITVSIILVLAMLIVVALLVHKSLNGSYEKKEKSEAMEHIEKYGSSPVENLNKAQLYVLVDAYSKVGDNDSVIKMGQYLLDHYQLDSMEKIALLDMVGASYREKKQWDKEFALYDNHLKEEEFFLHVYKAQSYKGRGMSYEQKQELQEALKYARTGAESRAVQSDLSKLA